MRRERGLALILALLLVAAAALLALSVSGRARDLAMDDARDRATMQARWAAEGGIEHARRTLAHEADYTRETLTIGRCEVSVQILPARDATRTITAVATAPAAPFAETVSQRIEIDVAPAESALPAVAAWRD